MIYVLTKNMCSFLATKITTRLNQESNEHLFFEQFWCGVGELGAGELFSRAAALILPVIRTPAPGRRPPAEARAPLAPIVSCPRSVHPSAPLWFECSRHRQTLRPTVDGTRSKALRPFGLQ